MLTAVDRCKTHIIRLLIFQRGNIENTSRVNSKKRGTFRVHKICELAKKRVILLLLLYLLHDLRHFYKQLI